MGIEDEVDYTATALMASRSFSQSDERFSAAYLKWLYETAFHRPAIVVTARVDGKKAGQAVILWQRFFFQGWHTVCAQLVDLFIAPEFRSPMLVRAIYGELRSCLADHRAMVLTVPNNKSVILNRRFLKLQLIRKLEIRIGMACPYNSRNVTSLFHDAGNTESTRLLIEHSPMSLTGCQPVWDAGALINRLANPLRRYAIHKSPSLLAITSRRVFRGLPVVLVAGLLPLDNRSAGDKEVGDILRNAALLHRCPAYLYVGVNQFLKVPGVALPTRLRPSQMLVQGNMQPENDGARDLSRFEAIDFDFG
ncbi:MAG: hypothetical protein ACT6RN_18085 [Agrobacterium sp.]|uniref:hypothetical protein n=1 Tax=Agrobacterium sp. TaxID=361 RepID=UPI0040333631